MVPSVDLAVPDSARFVARSNDASLTEKGASITNSL